jgi:gluconate kinase
MFIVIEGTDASGKSSLIDAVHNELKSQYPNKTIHLFHKGRPEEETRRWVLNEYVTKLEDTDWCNAIGLSDRWHWGEATYAPLKRAHTNKDGFGLLGVAGWRWVELFLQSRGVLQVWLYQPLEVIQKRLASRGDDFVNVDELETILGLYQNAAKHSIHVGIQPEPESLDKVEALAKTIVELAKEHSKDTEMLSTRFPKYIGSPKPSALLVGDTRNIKEKYGEETQLPFMPVDGNSGDYLLRALPDEFWKTVGIVNVNDVNEDIYDLWVSLGRPKIVALGRLAARGLERNGIGNDLFRTLPHPQYVRRFHNKDMVEYGEAIQRNATNTHMEDKWILR